jgi:D-glycero-alpha-D-manno-heptose-7-phosphate kinase
VSLFGGGTDLPAFFNVHGSGMVINFAVKKYIYVTVNRRFDSKIRVSYQKVEIVDNVELIEHSIARECLIYLGIHSSIEITFISDFPGGTGLGSSSSLAVGLLHALHRFNGNEITPTELAEQACYIEIEALRKPNGKQDQYAVAVGGINAFEFKNTGTKIFPIKLSKTLEERILDSFRLIYTGISREADIILKEVSEMKPATINSLIEQKKIADDVFSLWVNSPELITLDYISEKLNQAWIVKQKYSSKITNESIDQILQILKMNGAISTKLLGAGGGGFILAIMNSKKSQMKFLEDFQSFNLEIDKSGSVIIYE